MNVFLEQTGRDEVDLVLTDEPTTEQDEHGDSVAQIPCILPASRERIKDARIRVEYDRGVPWLGRVASVDEGVGGRAVLACVGMWHDLGRKLIGPKLYCDTSLSAWKPRSAVGTAKGWQLSVESTRLALIETGITAVNAYHGFWREIPTTTSSRITFAWSAESTNTQVEVYYGTTTNGNEPGSWTLAHAAYAYGATPVDLTISASHNAVLIQYKHITAESDWGTGEGENYIIGPKVYGVAGVTTVNPSTIIADVMGDLPTWILPAGVEALAFIDADTTTIEPFVHDADATAQSVLADLMQYRDYDLRFVPRLVAGRWTPVPVYTARSETPAYEVACGGDDVAASLSGDDVTTLARKVRVLYSRADGVSAYVDVTDTDEGNYLVAIDHDYDATLRCETTSSTLATAFGTKYLARHRAAKVSGSLRVDSPLRTLAGAEAYPCEVRSCAYVRLHDTPYGTVDARITDVKKVGDHSASLTLDNKPADIETELALLGKREQ